MHGHSDQGIWRIKRIDTHCIRWTFVILTWRVDFIQHTGVQIENALSLPDNGFFFLFAVCTAVNAGTPSPVERRDPLVEFALRNNSPHQELGPFALDVSVRMRPEPNTRAKTGIASETWEARRW
jgi:hypothetical protein